MAKRLTVWWNGDVVGQLTPNQYDGGLMFSYAKSWLMRTDAQAVSVSLPLQPERFNNRKSLPFFEGLLPEASQRSIIAKVLGVSERNEFRLLEKIGGEVAGVIQIWPENTEPVDSFPNSASKILSGDEIVALIDRLPTRPMLAGGEDGLRLSLAGAQSKLPVICRGGKISLPAPGMPTTHILKPEISGFKGTAENEAFCMRLGAAIGLDVAGVDYRRIGEKRFILVERYDRQTDKKGHITRRHQEDFCQALSYLSTQKYASDGGPIFRNCFELVRRVTTRPAIETSKLLDVALFNIIIGNADAHAKNFSLLYYDDRTELAPLYDLLSTVVYPELTPYFAMKVGGRRTLEELRSKDFEKFAKDIEFRAPFIRQRFGEIANLVLERADDVLAQLGLQADSLQNAQDFSEGIQKRSRTALKILGYS